MVRITRNKKKPFFQEMILRFPVFSNFKVTVVISEDSFASSCYIADRDYVAGPPEGLSIGSEAFTVSSVLGGWATIYLKPDAGLGTVAHESYHAVCAMMAMIGAKEEHEVMAYHLGYLVDLVTEFNLKVAGRFKKGKKSNHDVPKL